MTESPGLESISRAWFQEPFLPSFVLSTRDCVLNRDDDLIGWTLPSECGQRGEGFMEVKVLDKGRKTVYVQSSYKSLTIP
jgi:hypothetical protein